MKVLVTGASSLLGRATCRLLDQRGEDVTCFQRGPSGTGLRDIAGDVRDRSGVLAAADGVDAVIHMAALVGPRPKWDDAYEVNVLGTTHVAEAAQGCGRFVHISSPSVAFDDRPAVGVGAEAPTYRGNDNYAHTKALAEGIVLKSPIVPTVVVRPHLVWGPGDTQLIGRIITRASQGRLVLPDGGRALVDTTYVDDAAAAVVAALDHAHFDDEAHGRAWVVSGADPRPLAELIDGILGAAGISTPVRSVPAPLAATVGRAVGRLWHGTEPPLTYFAARQLSLAHWFDQTEVQRVLGWRPEVSVDAGMARLARWFSAEG